MKKILFGTTALLAAGAFVSTAQASDPVKLSLGGYMEYWVAGANQDSDFTTANGVNRGVNSFDIQGESEIWFGGKTTLDNGMTIGVDVQLEAGSNDNGTDVIDESYLYVEGKYGKMILGAENDAAYLMSLSAPDASQMGGAHTTSEGDTIQYLPVPVTSLDTVMNVAGDQNKITYFTPKFYGFQLGASYAGSGNSGGDDNGVPASESVAKVANFDEAWAFGASYAGAFSGVGVKASAGWVILDSATHGASLVNVGDGKVQEFGGGLHLSYQGFTVGGSAKRRIDPRSATGLAATAASTDGFVWNAGVMYAEGPYKVSLNYVNSEAEGLVNNNGHDEVDIWRVGGSYDLGPGVILFSEIAYSNAQDETGAAAAGNEGAYGGVVGLHLNF